MYTGVHLPCSVAFSVLVHVEMIVWYHAGAILFPVEVYGGFLGGLGSPYFGVYRVSCGVILCWFISISTMVVS